MARASKRDVSLEEQECAQRAMLDLLAEPAHKPAPMEMPLEGPWLKVTGGALPVSVQISKADDGRLICTGLLVGWEEPRTEVTARALRAISLPDLLNRVVRLAEDAPNEHARTAARDLLDDAPAMRPRRPGPAGWPDEHFRHVADRYRVALLRSPGKPINWLAGDLHASEATVHRWLQRARDKGFLEKRDRRGPR